jgi:hypothetical protein
MAEHDASDRAMAERLDVVARNLVALKFGDWIGPLVEAAARLRERSPEGHDTMAEWICPSCGVTHDTALLRTRLRERSPADEGERWNDALEAAAKMANARFLVDPLTSPAIHILGLRKPKNCASKESRSTTFQDAPHAPHGDAPSEGWQPIESAPRHFNTSLLLWFPTETVEQHGFIFIGTWHYPNDDQLPSEPMWVDPDDGERLGTPTLWQPLPKAPQP